MNDHKLSEDQRQLLEQTVLKDFAANDRRMFVAIVERTGLDPLTRQIYPVKRRSKVGNDWVEKLEPQVSIDGFRLIAERSNHYAGQLGPLWCGWDGEWKEVWLEKDMPAAAKVGVMRHDFKEPLFAVARFDSYVQKDKDGNPAKFWKQMPELMIGKVAEALALRRAFPQELSGLYTAEEMAQAENDPQPEATRPTRSTATKSTKTYGTNGSHGDHRPEPITAQIQDRHDDGPRCVPDGPGKVPSQREEAQGEEVSKYSIAKSMIQNGATQSQLDRYRERVKQSAELTDDEKATLMGLADQREQELQPAGAR